MKLLSRNVKKDLEEIIETIECGDDILFINSSKEKFIIAREEFNNKNATSINCADASISSFHIHTEVLDLFANSKCYTDFKYRIEIYE